MLRNVDPHGQPSERKLKVGDRVRFPIDDLTRPRGGLYRHTFEVVSFGFVTTKLCGNPSRGQWSERDSRRHVVTVRRLADGWTATVGAWQVVRYRDDDHWYDWYATRDYTGHSNYRRLHPKYGPPAPSSRWRRRAARREWQLKALAWRLFEGEATIAA